jgi:hypothetical protein
VKATGVVASGGFWTETYQGTVYNNVITGGMLPLSGTPVNLKFSRGGSPAFEFNGSALITPPTGSLTGSLASPQPANTFVTTGGSVTCTAVTAMQYRGGHDDEDDD